MSQIDLWPVAKRYGVGFGLSDLKAAVWEATRLGGAFRSAIGPILLRISNVLNGHAPEKSNADARRGEIKLLTRNVSAISTYGIERERPRRDRRRCLLPQAVGRTHPE